MKFRLYNNNEVQDFTTIPGIMENYINFKKKIKK